MKFTTKIFILYFFLFQFTFGNLKGQSGYEFGMPHIQNYELKAFGYQNQTYSILQDDLGVLYFGNINGVLRFDGYNWNLIPVKGIPKLVISENKIYGGGYSTFGFVDVDETGKLVFTEIINSLNNKPFGQVDKIVEFQGKIYFTVDGNLVKYSEEEQIEILDTAQSGLLLAKISDTDDGNGLYFYSKENGLRVIEEGNLQPFEPAKKFNKKIQNLFSYKGFFFLNMEGEDQVHFFNGENFVQMKSESYSFLSPFSVSKFTQLFDNMYAVSTLEDGIFIIDEKDKVIAHFNEENGLSSNQINDLYIDQKGSIWASQNTGISRIEFPSAFSLFNKQNGIDGNVNSILRFEGRLYVATDKGVYMLQPNERIAMFGLPSKFVQVENSSMGAVVLYEMNKNLYFTNHRGIYKVVNSKAELFYDAKYNEFNVLELSKFQKNLIYLGTGKGMLVLKYLNQEWIKIGVLQNFGYSIKNIVEDNDGAVWVVTDYNGCFRIPPNDFFDINSSIDLFRVKEGLPGDIQWITPVKTSGKVLFMTSKGVFHYNFKENKFDVNNTFGSEFSTSDRWIYPIVEDEFNNYWYSEVITDQNFSRSTYVARYDNSIKKRSISKLPINKIKEFDIQYIYPDSNEVIWFGGNKGLIRFDNLLFERKAKEKFSVIINGIGVMEDSITKVVPLYGRTSTELQFSARDLRFECAATDYQSGNQLNYHYKLENYSSNWSVWTSSNYKEYTNLRSGDYRFVVQAKDINGILSDIASLSFNIKKSVFLSTIAIILYIIGAIFFIIVCVYWLYYINLNERYKLETIINQRTDELVDEKEKAENLISRVLNKQSINNFQKEDEASAKRIKMASVLFSDIHGFRKISDKVNSEVLIDELDNFSIKFESVVRRHNIERVKTIGDMYLCVGGIPEANRTNPIEVIMAAIELQHFMHEVQNKRKENEHIWDLRIGIDTGPVIIGVSGRRKKSFDVWGATVNTANRLESAGEPGKINISGNTYMLVKDYFVCKYYGKVPVKNKGDIDMFYVEGFKPKFSENFEGLKPNREFIVQLQTLRLGDLEEFVMAKLDQGLPSTLYYHNLKHTVDVYTQVELIGRSEDLSKEDLLILRTAALFHDMGHLIDYFTHEEQGVKLVKEILPEYNYDEEQIEKICSLIMITKMPPNPTTLMEKIICDADLDYLGRSDFIPVSNNLYKELRERGHLGTLAEWNKMQMKFLEKHSYYTKTASDLRDGNKHKQLELIRKIVEEEGKIIE